jgi:hypothetical protein
MLGVIVNVAHYAIFGTWSADLMALFLGGYTVKETADKIGSGIAGRGPGPKPDGVDG